MATEYAEIHERLAGSPLAQTFADMQRRLEDHERDYNGWKNYPTWAVNLWLANDELLYREALERTEEQMSSARSARSKLDHPSWTQEESFRFHVADMLKDWVTDELAPDLGASFAADLLGYALGEVDWNEIADAWIESVNDQS